MKEIIKLCGIEYEVIRRYELTDEYMKEYSLNYKKRITVRHPDGHTEDFADTF